MLIIALTREEGISFASTLRRNFEQLQHRSCSNGVPKYVALFQIFTCADDHTLHAFLTALGTTADNKKS